MILLAMTAAAAAQPGFAQTMQTAINYSSQAEAASAFQSGPSDAVRAAAYASSMGAALMGAAASQQQRETRRRVPLDGSAETALLAGAGILAPLPHLPPLPLCTKEDQRDYCRHSAEARKNP
jgi:hypothetical protein